MEAGLQLAVLAVFMVLCMTAGWAWQRRHRNAGIVDAIWSGGVGVGALWIAATGTGAATPRLLLALLAGLWSARLAWHIWQRVRGSDEDGRYRYLREHWRDDQRKFYLFFMAQVLLVLLFALPFVAVAQHPEAGLTPLRWLAVAIALGAIAGESLADRQLAAFRADPRNRGRVCRAGLWRYSRHPNYFFEWLHWFAYVVLAIGAPLGWLAWIGPLAMYVFLRWFSGVPYTEAQSLRTRGDDYRAYQQSTPMFFPWFPKTSSESRSAE